jgi:superfamily II DNA or RNA helicase
MTSILELYGNLSPDEQRRGRQFERICKWFLENDPEYKRQIKRVWLWDDWPGRWGRDKGIDLVAETFDEKFWAVQSKAYALNYSVTKHDTDKFLSESSRKIISYRLLIATAAGLGHNAKEVIQGQEKPVGTLFLSDLKNRKLNWPSSPDKLFARQEKPNKSRRDQQRAIADVVCGFKSHPRGQLIRACGTGKTLIGLRVAEAMKSRRTLVLVPSLSLVSQILSDWAKDGLRPFRFLPVCSDETIGGEDHLVAHVSQLGVPATTNPSEIAEFMRGAGRRVVFSTYQSTPTVALAFKQHKLKPFDLVIADEAHRCAGVKDGAFATILDSQEIRARKRLFMTATPRIASEASKSRADSMGLELVSMDDHKVFGPVFHELKFSEAIRLKLLTDYRVEIIGVDDPLYRQYAEQGRFVTLDGKTVTDARNLTSHIAVAKAMKKYDLRRIITFHGRVARAREFADQFPQFIRWMPQADIPSGEIWTELISGDMASNKRDAILDRLREVQPPARGIVTNARCLSEGIDVRALDGVAFIDPKESQVDIIQAVGRAIRKAERKKHGIIILPVYISSGEDEEKTLEDSSFKQVWRVLRALRSHDDQLASELDNLRANLGRQGKVRANLPAKITINLPTRLSAKFADAFYLRTVRAITPPPPLTEDQILHWADAHYEKTDKWPRVASGNVLGAAGEKWGNVHLALSRGLRGLPGGSSLARLLAEKRGTRNIAALPALAITQILQWADAQHQKTHQWPNQTSSDVLGAPGEKWGNINQALSIGLRGLPGGSLLAKLLADKRGVRNRSYLPTLTIRTILKWADAHHERTGQWPTSESGDVPDAPGEKWGNINAVLDRGNRSLASGSSLAQLLAKHRGVQNVNSPPKLSIDQILQWADAHNQETGEWPNENSGDVSGTPGETWGKIQNALYKGGRSLPSGSSLAKLLAEKRGVRNQKALPVLTIEQILKWADAHHQKTHQWPNQTSGDVLGAPGEKWGTIDGALSQGRRGLLGGSSLAKLLAEMRGVRNRMALSDLTIEQIIRWVDAHHKKTGEWPIATSGEVLGAPSEKWTNINAALIHGRRGLPGVSTLAQLLADKRGVRNTAALPDLTIEQILKWADAHYEKTGKWPNENSGDVLGASSETWRSIVGALSKGRRGLPSGSTLAQLLVQKRGVRNKSYLPTLTIQTILKWADAHYRKTGQWPKTTSGGVLAAPGEEWGNIQAVLYAGDRGLPGGSSLAKLLAEKRGVRNTKTLPSLTIQKILKWADAHHQKTGQWPISNSGDVLDAPGEKWANIHTALSQGRRGLPSGSSLAKLLAEKRAANLRKPK